MTALSELRVRELVREEFALLMVHEVRVNEGTSIKAATARIDSALAHFKVSGDFAQFVDRVDGSAEARVEVVDLASDGLLAGLVDGGAEGEGVAESLEDCGGFHARNLPRRDPT